MKHVEWCANLKSRLSSVFFFFSFQHRYESFLAFHLNRWAIVLVGQQCVIVELLEGYDHRSCFAYWEWLPSFVWFEPFLGVSVNNILDRCGTVSFSIYCQKISYFLQFITTLLPFFIDILFFLLFAFVLFFLCWCVSLLHIIRGEKRNDETLISPSFMNTVYKKHKGLKDSLFCSFGISGIGCNLYGMGVAFFGLNSIITLSAIACERYIVITSSSCRPVVAKWRITRRQAQKVIKNEIIFCFIFWDFTYQTDQCLAKCLNRLICLNDMDGLGSFEFWLSVLSHQLE